MTDKSDGLPRTSRDRFQSPRHRRARVRLRIGCRWKSKVTPISAKVQPYNGPNAWMPLLESGEVDFGIINILDSHMAATGTGNYKKAYPCIRVVSGGVFPFTGSLMVRATNRKSRQPSDLKGKRIAWDFGGHAITHTWQLATLETVGLKASDLTQVRFSNLNEAIRAVPEGKGATDYSRDRDCH